MTGCSVWQSPSEDILTLPQLLRQHWPALSALTIEYWPADAPARYQNQPLRLTFKLPTDTTLSNDEIRSILEPWLLEQQHPEALCLSIEKNLSDGLAQFQLEIVCRI
ncbi:MAG: hypothetical protein IGS03_17245 [Candidatus Sericytochromatia bacterium]|nr:hypothetical protein [Candidatus Sericytochromatia bacterium]